MGISAILSAAMKHISWDHVANIAIQYGPDFFRKIKGRMQAGSTTASDGTVVADPTDARISELESEMIKQGELIQQLNRTIELLEQNCKTLQARLNIFATVAVISAVLSMAVFVLLMVK